jgi:hypothetical protein
MFGMTMSPFLLRAATVIGRLPRDRSFICLDAPLGYGPLESWIEVLSKPWIAGNVRTTLDSRYARDSGGSPMQLELVGDDFKRALGRPPDRGRELFAGALLLQPSSLLKISDLSLGLLGVRSHPGVGDVYSFTISWSQALYEPR